ncbi:MAG: translocation and assembly module protein TamB [Alphaproteobacteria bacterium HGW-Alphaproteobacteria-4]|nr:MAG: translocation and assembly module protein TamB [Alphaproteobacteria bacterium HGW-Alphaproteobacteria-4]
MRRLLIPLMLTVLALGTPAWAQSEAERDRGLIQGLLEDNLSGAGRAVRIEGFAGALSSRATFTEMTIADDAGVWLSIRGGAISWNRAALVAGRIEIAELGAEEIVLERMPNAGATAAVPEAVPFALPELPVSVAIGKIAAKRVELGAAVLGAPAVLRLDGALNLAGGEGSARLAADRIDGQPGTFTLSGSFANATRHLVLDLLLDEAAGGIAANLLGLPERPALKLAIAGSGPLESFSADVVLSSDRAKRLVGRVVMSAPDAETRRFVADLGGDVAPLLPPEYRSFFGADVALHAEGARAADGGLSLSTLRLHSAALSLDGALDLLASGAPRRAALNLVLGLPEAPEVLLPITGEKTWVAGATLTLGYDQAAGEQWQVDGSLEGLRRGGVQVGVIELAGSGRIGGGDTALVSGALEFSARDVAFADATLNAALGDSLRGQVQLDWRAGEPVRLPVVSLTAGGASLNGTAEVSGSGAETRASGNFRLSHPNLAQLSPLAGRSIGGRFDGVVEGWYLPLMGDFFVETAFVGIDLKTGQSALDRLLVGGSRVRLIAERDANGLTLALDAHAKGFSGQAEGLLQSGATTATASFALPDMSLAGAGWKGAMAANATVAGVPGARVLAVAGTGSGLGVGEPTLDRLLAGEVDLRIGAQEGPGGWTLGTAELANPQVTAALGVANAAGARILTARLADVALLAPGFSGPAAVSGQVEAGGDGYAVALSAQGPGGSNATITGPIAASFASVDLAIAGRAEAALLNRLLSPRSLQGPVSFDLRLRGALALGALSGRVSGNGLRLSAPGLGIAVQDIQLSADLEGARARLTASGTMGGGGLRLSGPVAMLAPYTADLSLALQDVPLRDPNLYDTRLSGNLSISGALAGGAQISGAVTLAQTTIRVPEAGAVLALPDVTHVGAPAEVAATVRRASPHQTTGAGSGGPVYGLDIAVFAPRRIFVRGRGLDAELGGALRLGGTTAAVVPSGQFDLVRGRLDILGKRFTLSEGLVQMQGALSPWLRFAATTQTADITATITLEGEAAAPELRLSSSPDLPQDEVLAQLLFSRGIESLSPLQAARMAQAVAQLAGRGGEGLMGRLRVAFGLDDFDLATDTAGGTTLRFGKYLSDNLYSDVAVGSNGKAEINLNLDITPSLTARGTLGADGNSGIGIYFERDY